VLNEVAGFFEQEVTEATEESGRRSHTGKVIDSLLASSRCPTMMQ